MNKNVFKSKLDNAIKNNALSIYFIEGLFKKEKQSLFNNEKIENLVINNFASIIDNIGIGNVDTLVDVLYSYDSMKSFLEDENIIGYLLFTTDHYDFQTILLDSELKHKAKEYIENNFDYVIENYPTKKIATIYGDLELNKEMKDKINIYFDKKKEEFVKEILTSTLKIKGNVDEKKLHTLVTLVTSLVDKALKDEGCTIADTEIYRGGGFSNVLRIGNIIIKVGLPRKTFNIPNDKRLLQPHLRRDLRESHGINAVIEVCDRVDTNLNLSEDELYLIYKDIRDRGIICGDFKSDNVGVLLRDNIPCNDSKNGMIGQVSETLQEGEYVVLDTDFIYNADDENVLLTSDLSRKFESRYKKQANDKLR